MDLTMLRQMARNCQLLAYLDNSASSSLEMSTFRDILDPGNITKRSLIQPIGDSEQATYLYDKGTTIDRPKYNMILEYLNSTGHHGQYHSNQTSHLHENALVLPPLAKQCTEFHENGRTYSCYSSHEGNSLVQFYDRQISAYRTGVIKNIFEIPLQGYLQKFILVSPHCDLPQSELKDTPYDPTLYPRFMSKIVEVNLLEEIIVVEPKHIITHLTTYKTEGSIFGISRPIRLVCWALNRERKKYPV
jgi:hypothetical protein